MHAGSLLCYKIKLCELFHLSTNTSTSEKNSQKCAFKNSPSFLLTFQNPFYHNVNQVKGQFK